MSEEKSVENKSLETINGLINPVTMSEVKFWSNGELRKVQYRSPESATKVRKVLGGSVDDWNISVDGFTATHILMKHVDYNAVGIVLCVKFLEPEKIEIMLDGCLDNHFMKRYPKAPKAFISEATPQPVTRMKVSDVHRNRRVIYMDFLDESEVLSKISMYGEVTMIKKWRLCLEVSECFDFDEIVGYAENLCTLLGGKHD